MEQKPISSREELIDFLVANGYTKPSDEETEEAVWWATRGYKALGKQPSPVRSFPDVYWLDAEVDGAAGGGYAFSFDVVFICAPKRAQMETLVHELTHWLQGATESTVEVAASDPVAYANLTIEVEARLVQNMYKIGTIDPMDPAVIERQERMTAAVIDGAQRMALIMVGA